MMAFITTVDCATGAVEERPETEKETAARLAGIPPSLGVSTDTVAVGETFLASVVYLANAPESVTFLVNGLEVVEPVTDSEAIIEIEAVEPGLITIEAVGQSVTVEVI